MTGGGIIVAGAEGSDTGGGLAWATPASAARTVTTLNEQILLDDEATDPRATTATEGRRSGSRSRRSPAWPSRCARG